jgi:hypothetical protein
MYKENVVPSVMFVIAMILLAILFCWLAYMVRLPLVNWDRFVGEHSHAYLDSKVTQLVDAYTNYHALDAKIVEYRDQPEAVTAYKAQQANLKRMMCVTYAQLPEDVRAEKTPDYIELFLVDCQ